MRGDFRCRDRSYKKCLLPDGFAQVFQGLVLPVAASTEALRCLLLHLEASGKREFGSVGERKTQ